MIQFFQMIWNEPEAPGRQNRHWGDWLLSFVVAATAIFEVTVRPEMEWRIPSLVLVLAMSVILLFRRTRPLFAAVTMLSAIGVAQLVSAIMGIEWEGLYATAMILIIPFSVARWAAGWKVDLMVGVMIVSNIIVNLTDAQNIGEVIGGTIVFFFPVLLGLGMRYQHNLHARRMDEATNAERVQLARELHDTVAHHVSAIAIQAQAGQALAATKPEAAVEALSVIEAEASRTLAELRGMVGALRDEADTPEFAPQPGLANVVTLATQPGERPLISVDLDGDLDDLRPALGTAIFRLAQESVTNARRHARNATRIDVKVEGGPDLVRVTVSDDGQPASTTRGTSLGGGFGLVGMAERAKLLGGSFTAGFDPGPGWTVAAVLPRQPLR